MSLEMAFFVRLRHRDEGGMRQKDGEDGVVPPQVPMANHRDERGKKEKGEDEQDGVAALVVPMVNYSNEGGKR